MRLNDGRAEGNPTPRPAVVSVPGLEGRRCRVAVLGARHGRWLFRGAHRMLAEAGASAHVIMSITGHQSLAEVERYTAAARREKLADAAMRKLR